MIEPRTETLALTDGGALRMTVAEPEHVVRGGLVVLHEARGVTGRVRSLLASLAEEGWLAAAPHLYHRDAVDPLPDDAPAADAEPQVARLTAEAVLDDSDAAFLWLSGRGVPADRQGVLGFDVGGSAALLVAASRSVGAAVSAGGRGIVTPLSPGMPALAEIAGELSCPWLGIYREEGAVPAGEVAKLREAADRARVATDVVLTSGGGDADPAVDAWTRARNWFDTHLR